jgi:hypothetical protein
MLAQIEILANGTAKVFLFPVAQLLMPGSSLVSIRTSFMDSASCRRRLPVIVWESMSDDPPSSVTRGSAMLTQPLGPMTSFTKYAVWLIIGPHPASYHPTDPSSNTTCKWP